MSLLTEKQKALIEENKKKALEKLLIKQQNSPNQNTKVSLCKSSSKIVKQTFPNELIKNADQNSPRKLSTVSSQNLSHKVRKKTFNIPVTASLASLANSSIASDSFSHSIKNSLEMHMSSSSTPNDSNLFYPKCSKETQNLTNKSISLDANSTMQSISKRSEANRLKAIQKCKQKSIFTNTINSQGNAVTPTKFEETCMYYLYS